ncbi:MAG: leucine--tRNA ligase, partial [Gammaproteobacteria bacterium]|nr:leucine--tRNA ligase [Gammaproteobacteria bacterium]
MLGEKDSVVNTPWPEADESARVRDQITLAVQINGKLRARIELAPGSDEQTAMTAAMAEQNVTRYTEGKETRKVIYIPDRLLNIVVS